MSEKPNPPPPPENKPAEAKPPQQQAGARPPRRDRGPREPRESMPQLDDLSSRGPNLRELDAALQDELDAALAGFDQQKLVAGEEPKAQAGPAGGKKGRVIAIHGED